MPSFKYKTNKKITVDDKSIVTLDNRHKEMQLHFSNVTNIIMNFNELTIIITFMCLYNNHYALILINNN